MVVVVVVGGGGWASYQIFKKGDLAGSQILEWVDETEGVRGGDLFRGGGGGGGHSFYIKNKLKSEILNDKKSL